jgi:hypothetical protein
MANLCQHKVTSLKYLVLSSHTSRDGAAKTVYLLPAKIKLGIYWFNNF